MTKKIIYAIWIAFISLLLLTVAIFTAISTGLIGYMPPIEELENPSYKFATEIYSEDGKVLGTFSLSKENRVFTSYNELPKSIIDALVATEDVRFFEHSGIDVRALGRALIKRGLFFQRNAGGGSTLSQQLAKQLYSPNADNYVERVLQKPIEWVIATKLERYYTKEEILTMYLNKFDFLNNAVGIKTAAAVYFSKKPNELTTEESATLVGMCKNPSLFNPIRHADRSVGRRNTVLDQMNKYDFISQAEKDSLEKIPLKLKYSRVDHKEGSATYFREYLRAIMSAKKPNRVNYKGYQMQKYTEDSLAWSSNALYGWCEKNTKPDGSKYNLYTDGLKIHTTIDSRMQKYAEEAVEEHLGMYLQPRFFAEKKGKSKAPYSNMLSQTMVDSLLTKAMKQSDRYKKGIANGLSESEIRKQFNTKTEMQVFSWRSGSVDTIMTPMDSIRYHKLILRTGFVSMDPITGGVKAYVGGPNYAFFQYDMAMQGRRQVGSTIKPFLYSLAMENGFSPCDETLNVEQTVPLDNGETWSPRNGSRARYGEKVTLKWGLANSNNWISAYLMSRLNPFALVRLIHDFGVTNKEIMPTPSLCLGPCEISVGEMVSAYTAFVNKGIRTEAILVTTIEDSNGNVISSFSPKVNEVISEESANKMLIMLRAVINEGTGGRVRRYGIMSDIGGKTGTTQRNADGWFMGITPRLVSGCWVGGEERDIHFDTMVDGQGAAMALPIWGIFMRKVYDDRTLNYSRSARFEISSSFVPCDTKVEAKDENAVDAVFE